MASFKLVFLFTLISFVHFATSKAPALGNQSVHPFVDFNSDTVKPDSSFQSNLRTLFDYLTSNASNKEFYNTTVPGRSTSDTVHGLFMCRGDLPSQLCGQCVSKATKSYRSNLDWHSSNEAVVLNDECMVRYSDLYFFSTVDLSSPSCNEFTYVNASASFMRLLLGTMNKTADEAASPPILVKKYATNEVRISGFQCLYCLAQCTPDLSPRDCRTCLNVMISQLQQGQCNRVQNPSCYVQYDFYPFYRPDSKQPEDPDYLSHNCSSNEAIIANSTFRSNLRTLFSYLSSNATSKTGFHNTTVGGRNSSGTVNGLFMCRGDTSPRLCQLCVQNATERIFLECGSSKEAIIWYNHCLLRYSNVSIGYDTSPSFREFNVADTFNSDDQQQNLSFTLGNTLSNLENAIRETATKNYGTATAKLNDDQTLYALGQCTPDLSDEDCFTCLRNMKQEIPWCCLASPEGKVLSLSCYLMFGLSKFYGDGDEVEAIGPANPPQGNTEKKKGRPQAIILIVVSIIVVAAMLLCLGRWYLLRRKQRKSCKTVLRENFGDEGATLEPLQFDIAIIKAATNNFSPENMIGRGGFGEVYKGILYDGRHIAVKRLSEISKQGMIEFKNEVLLIAKFQHRNLVTFIGFCLNDQEKILIYEYVPNGSLDYFLFDTQQQKLLNWSQRYKIIKGIALGIHYLHEHSRPKIIHRDLKPSNILLDESMNPKLSDFGIARIIEIDEDQEITNRIVGTFGYMSPEYLMLGHFSEKSDIFSFGVMILEIITGKKNSSSYKPHQDAAGLLSYVWRKWKDQIPSSILDQKLKENYVQSEVIKCIQIGLLCVQENPDVRPPMVTVISYLDNHSIELPSPREPAFFLHGRLDQNIIARESSSGHDFNNSTLSSINEVSISEFLPR